LSFRLIIHPKMDGRLAMALDEVLLEEVGEGRSAQTVRLYGFAPPTLSVGRFQPVLGGLDAELMRKDGVAFVRRPTGGHAVLHDDELTYSFILSKQELGKAFGPYRKRGVYAYIAESLLAGLEALGIHALVNSGRIGDHRNPDCFASTGEYEITDESGRKLVGSAQMTTRGAVLQQGSIPISNPSGRVSRYLPQAGLPPDHEAPTCLREAAGRAIGFEEAENAFAAVLRKRFGALDSRMTEKEETAARLLMEDKYAVDAWNLRA
jgi:lipoate-protein ligase A